MICPSNYCQKKLNEDRCRYKWLCRFHAIECLFTLIRFIILCTDLSSCPDQPGSSAFLIPIFLLELSSGIIILLANLVYITLHYVSPILFETDDDDIAYCPRKRIFHLSTFTCFKCDCYYDNPHTILLTRIAILIGFFLLRFIAFILGATCANRFPPRAIAYTVFSSFSFIFAIGIIVIEYHHHHRLWNYCPDGETKSSRFQKHKGFLPYSIINDQRTTSWRSSLCKRHSCRSQAFFHVLLYHSSATQFRVTDQRSNQKVIGFHQTDQLAAYNISKEGINPSPSRGSLFGAGVYFATCIDHTEFKAHSKGAYIVARVNLGRVFLTKVRGQQPENRNSYDSIYFIHPNGSDEFVLFNPDFIIEWVIVVNQDHSIRHGFKTDQDQIEDRFMSEVYRGCLF